MIQRVSAADLRALRGERNRGEGIAPSSTVGATAASERSWKVGGLQMSIVGPGAHPPIRFNGAPEATQVSLAEQIRSYVEHSSRGDAAIALSNEV